MLRGTPTTIAVLSLLVACSPRSGLSTISPSTTQQSATDSERWPWDGRDHSTHVLALLYDESGGRLRAAYTTVGGSPCYDSTPSDSALLRQGEDFLRGVGWNMLYPGQTVVAPFGKEFRRVTAHAGDLLANVLFHQDGGLVFSWSSVWDGAGSQFYPSDPVDPWLLTGAGSPAPSPASFTKVDPGWPDSLLSRARQLDVVQSLARRPYSATGFLFNRELQPFMRDASWVLLLVRRASCSP